MISIYEIVLFTILYLIYTRKINSIRDFNFKTDPEFFFNNILLFPECVVYCIMKIPVSFNIKRFERNGPNIIQLLKTLFNKNNFNEHKLFLSELLRAVKEEIINKYKFAWLELEREPITKKMKRCIYMIEYFRVYEDKCFNKQLLCPFCRVNNITSFIDKNVNKCKFNFYVGHIKSFYYGGLTDVDNLRPICGDCNRKMSKKIGLIMRWRFILKDFNKLKKTSFL